MKKQRLLQIARIMIQISMLFIFPGLFMMAFSELKEIVKMLTSGSFNLQKLVPASLEFMAVATFTAILGRFFCGWLCAFGTFNDLIYLISRKVFKTSFRIDEKTDSWLKYVKYVVLACILLSGPGLGMTTVGSASPWEAFTQITALPGALLSLPIGFFILFLITIGALFIERFFCRYLCPLGAFFSLVSRLSVLGIRRAGEGCGKCMECTDSCTMGLRSDKAGMIKGGDCINCMKCTGACPGKNIRLDVSGRRAITALACAAAMIILLGIFNFSDYSGKVTAQSDTGSVSNAAVNIAEDTGQKYKDGIAIQGNVDDSSADITAKSNMGDSNSNVVVQGNIDNNGKDILNQNNTDDNIDDVTAPENTEPVLDAASDAAENTTQKYKDGVYTGTGTGFRRGTTQIEVTISNGSITNIETVSHQDTLRFYNRVFDTVASEIISSQSADVDMVSGATYSCHGIAAAVEDALGKAQ